VKARTKFIIGALIVGSTSGYLATSSIKDTAQYYLTPTDLAAKVQSDSRFIDKGVKVGALVVKGTIDRDPSGRSVSFKMTDGGKTYPVSYAGVIPDTFTDGVEVVVEGKLNAQGTFEAKVLLAKCSSRYENAPDKNMPGYDNYKNTPAYKNATATGA
jgi:cytochrome c-type biogenesis protein CcmE